MSWFKQHFSWLSSLYKKLSSKETFLFLTFVVIAALFWALLAFNNNMTHDITVDHRAPLSSITFPGATDKLLTGASWGNRQDKQI